MFSIPQRYIHVTTYVLGIGIVVAMVLSWVHAGQKAEVVRVLEDRLALSRALLISLSEFTARNDVSEEIRVLMRDCPQRAEYEDMLSRLVSTFPLQEIERATALYDACGDFFALRKRLMVLRMELVYAEMSTYADIYKTYTQSTRYPEYLLKGWKPLIDMEREREELLSEQVALQGAIIRSLPGRQRQQLDAYLIRAQEIAESLDVKAHQLEGLRAEERAQWDALSL